MNYINNNDVKFINEYGYNSIDFVKVSEGRYCLIFTKKHGCYCDRIYYIDHLFGYHWDKGIRAPHILELNSKINESMEFIERITGCQCSFEWDDVYIHRTSPIHHDIKINIKLVINKDIDAIKKILEDDEHTSAHKETTPGGLPGTFLPYVNDNDIIGEDDID